MPIRVTAPAAISTVVGAPIAISIYPPAVIPIAAILCFATGIVAWHLGRGRRISIRRTSKGTLTVTLDSAGKTTRARGAR